MTTLRNRLEAFTPASTVAEMQDQFQQLAPTFLYGGYLQVGDDCRIYIRSVEFYFFDEHNESPCNCKEMYHRNGNFPRRPGKEEEDVDYFPMLSLHAHASGYDISFENKSAGFRASALIRGFVVDFKDVVDGEERWIRYRRKQLRPGVAGYVKVQSDTDFEERSTHMYALINGFSTQNGATGVRWVDAEEPYDERIKLQPQRRIGFKNAPASEKLWRFVYEDKE